LLNGVSRDVAGVGLPGGQTCLIRMFGGVGVGVGLGVGVGRGVGIGVGIALEWLGGVGFAFGVGSGFCIGPMTVFQMSGHTMMRMIGFMRFID